MLFLLTAALSVAATTSQSDTSPSVIVCKLGISRDQLLTFPIRSGYPTDPLSVDSPYVVDMVVDTGATHDLIFDPRVQAEKRNSYSVSPDGGEIKFQTFVVEQRGFNTVPFITVACNVPVIIPQSSVTMAAALKQDPGEPIQGIVGFNQDSLRDKTLFLTNAMPDWKSLAIEFPPVLQPGSGSNAMVIMKQSGNIRGNTEGPYMHVNSKHYWSTVVTELKVGNDAVIDPPKGKKITVVFDTGSNYFGASAGILNAIQDAIADGKLGLTIETAAYEDIDTDSKPYPVTMRFPSNSMGNFEKTLNRNFIVEKIDQSGFDDLATHEIILIGTRGLRGKKMSIFVKDSPPKSGEFAISIGNSIT
jgi:hypothetical protein